MTKEEIIEQLISEAMVECVWCHAPFYPSGVDRPAWLCHQCRSGNKR